MRRGMNHRSGCADHHFEVALPRPVVPYRYRSTALAATARLQSANTPRSDPSDLPRSLEAAYALLVLLGDESSDAPAPDWAWVAQHGRADGAETDAAGFLGGAAGSRAAADLAAGVRRGLPGLHADDVALCLEVDRFPFAMVVTLEDPLVVLRPCSAEATSVGGIGRLCGPR